MTQSDRRKKQKIKQKIRRIKMMVLKNQRSLDSIPKFKDSIIEGKSDILKQSKSVMKLPKITKGIQSAPNKKNQFRQSIDQRENESVQVSKLQDWTQNKPTQKSRTILNTHNISYLYRNSISSSGIIKHKTNQLTNLSKFLDAQVYLAKIDIELQKIGEINYFSIYKNLEFCCDVYENSFNTLLKEISKYRGIVQKELDQIQLKLQNDRKDHIRKVHLLQENANFHYNVNEIRETLQQKEESIKPVRKLLQKLDQARGKVLKYCLALGYDIRTQGLVWILRELGSVPKFQQFPQFLTQKQINFIITKYMNEKQALSSGNQNKPPIEVKTINEAYSYVNKLKKRQLSFIKQGQQLEKIYEDRIKDYKKQKHAYLDETTLIIAKQLEKSKPKPTRYEIIYNETVKNLNKITKEKIHPNKNKQNQNTQQSVKCESSRRREKRKSVEAIEEYSKLLNISISQSKKLNDLYIKEQKQFDEILRHMRNEKSNAKSSRRGQFKTFDQVKEQQFELRNAISVIGCLVGWKKTEKIIEQETFGI